MSARVIIAEDEAIVRRDLREMLELEGYEVVADLGRGDEALEAIGALKPDLAVLDIKMPGLDGLDVARRVQGSVPVAVVILTAFSQRALVEEARDAGVMAYLVKPFQAGELVAALELARARFDERQIIEAELARLRDEHERIAERLETRVLLDRAKAVLMERDGFTEAQAFRFLQKTAMNQRTRVRSIAEQVINGELSPSSTTD
ncbi:response regulator receiver and ANTAR domain protein [Acidimicrobium ferrooxidans DSM 10331]|uniref:Response regulator receiver and ANTAR domain protein n=1 Tax=Acidimicrobium ferrooxidans (strain DSM 10331 / JCM 15462 / NBRC 103882 / ICP) TaxID=525909 RepID=C7LZ57_ACIFD|nr:response regulator [Acidimicrobium ferrooxidans]ACU54015.1 response regulator receiver and ANTAR domain protein [Acidimicrobium ferrooxidans DSM 10331]